MPTKNFTPKQTDAKGYCRLFGKYVTLSYGYVLGVWAFLFTLYASKQLLLSASVYTLQIIIKIPKNTLKTASTLTYIQEYGFWHNFVIIRC